MLRGAIVSDVVLVAWLRAARRTAACNVDEMLHDCFIAHYCNIPCVLPRVARCVLHVVKRTLHAARRALHRGALHRGMLAIR
jgi:hypothetical protein